MEELLTKVDVARALRTTTRSIDNWIAAGTAPPSFKMGKLRRFPRSGLAAWMAARLAAGSLEKAA